MSDVIHTGDPYLTVRAAAQLRGLEPIGDERKFTFFCPVEDHGRSAVCTIVNGHGVLECGQGCGSQDLRDALGLYSWDVDPPPRNVEPRDDEDDGLPPIPSYPIEALPSAARTLVESGVGNGLPPALIAGACLGALAGAIGSRSSIEVSSGWVERAVVWPILVAPPGAGKSPALRLAMNPLRQGDGVNVHGDMTLEALARALHRADGTGTFCVDELSHFLASLGQYKGGSGGGDRSKLLELWDGAPWSLERVGSSKGEDNGLVLDITKPTVVVCGGLQPHLQDLLGSETDGFRARWLPHLAEMPTDTTLNGGVQASAWQTLIENVIDVRGVEREARLTTDGRLAWAARRKAWKEAMKEPEPAGVIGALSKADRHLLRIALILAEAENPGVPSDLVGADVIEPAAMIVDFTLDCWRAMPDNGGLGLSRREEKLERAVERWREWIESRPERKASAREIQRAHVGGVRTAKAFEQVLDVWIDTYPGTVVLEERRGNKTTVIEAPKRGRR